MSTDTALQDVRQAAEAQLLAARTLNPHDLRAASERRMALMEQLVGTEPPPSADALRRLQADLDVLDDRLGRLLLSSQRALRRLQPSNMIYDPSGRIREGAR